MDGLDIIEDTRMLRLLQYDVRSASSSPRGESLFTRRFLLKACVSPLQLWGFWKKQILYEDMADLR